MVQRGFRKNDQKGNRSLGGCDSFTNGIMSDFLNNKVIDARCLWRSCSLRTNRFACRF